MKPNITFILLLSLLMIGISCRDKTLNDFCENNDSIRIRVVNESGINFKLFKFNYNNDLFSFESIANNSTSDYIEMDNLSYGFFDYDPNRVFFGYYFKGITELDTVNFSFGLKCATGMVSEISTEGCYNITLKSSKTFLNDYYLCEITNER